MLKIFLGYDPREAVGYHTCVQSIIETTTPPFSITPLFATSDRQRDGSNRFTYSRFLVPYLCDYQGWALYLDGSDMLVMHDLVDLVANRFFDTLTLEPSGEDKQLPVYVVKLNYRTRHSRKYIGTPMECDNADYPRKNWSSVMLFNCGHFINRILTPGYVRATSGRELHTFQWVEANGHKIGRLHDHWNFLVGEYKKKDSLIPPGIAHYTLGIPAFKNYENCDYAGEWHKMREKAMVMV